MEIMTIEQIKAALGDRNLTVVSNRAGVAYSAIRKIMAGQGDKVSLRTAARLSAYLKGVNHG